MAHGSTHCAPTFGCVALLFVLSAVPALAQQTGTEPGQARNSRFEIAPRGYVQLDWRGYPDWDIATGTGRLNRETVEVRRLRGGVDGRWRAMSFEFTVDPFDDDGVFVKDAYAQWRFARWLRVRGGQFKVPGSREYLTAARSMDFMERSALADSIAPGRDIGGMATGQIGRALEYQAGLFAGDGNGRGSRAGLTSAGRVIWTLGEDLELAGSFSEGRTESVDQDPGNGLGGRAPSGFRFFERLYVRGSRTRFGADVEWQPGPWRFTAEVLRASDERAAQGLDVEDLPSVVGFGWSAAVRREFGRRRGQARSRIREWDLQLRFDSLAFDDTGEETLRDSVRPRATDVRARAARTVTAGVSWNLARWARVLGNASLERYSEPRSAPEAGRPGSYWALGTRVQLELP